LDKDGKRIAIPHIYRGGTYSWAVFPNGEILSSEDDIIKRCGNDGKLLSTISSGHGEVDALLALPNGEFVSAGRDRTIKRWRKDGKVMSSSSTGRGGVNLMVVLLNGEILSGGLDGTMTRWGKDGKALATIPTGLGPLKSLVLLRNGEILGAGQEGIIKRWSVDAVAKQGCLELQNHQIFREPQSPAQRAARANCQRLGVLKG
jgi:WD40 repeat protein